MSDIPATDVILEQMGIRVADMDHLVGPVIEDINEEMKMVGDHHNWLDDFDLAVEDLKTEYHENGATGRYFVVDTIADLVRTEAEG